VFNRRFALTALTAVLTGVIPLSASAQDRSTTATAAGGTITIFAAASMKNALDDVNAAFTKKTGIKTVASYAASSALMRQIENGAPADIFVSADLAWMNYGVQKKVIKDDTRVNLLGNRLVLIAPADSGASIEIGQGMDLAAALGDGYLAVGQVDSVPAGRYAREALTSLGIWDRVSGRLAQAENVRAAQALVATGEAPFGIVYATDAHVEAAVRVVAEFPADSHAPIIYPAAVTAEATSAAADAFMAFLRSETAAGLFQAEGFAVLAPVPVD
jgi:molybdate transport system substrate-binding protein